MIIDSMLQDDLYKFTMQQCVFRQYPKTTVKYKFTCRNKNIKLGFLANQVQEQVNHLSQLKLTNPEYKYLSSLGFFQVDYLNYLSNFKYNTDDVTIVDNDGQLDITISGLWLNTILYEVKILSIVNELYFKETTDFPTIKGRGIQNLKDKINLIYQYPTLTIAEFGTRRRYSRDWQKYVYQELIKHCSQVIGTSNIKLAMDTNTIPIGTMAHEMFSAHLSLVDNIQEAQKRALYVWLETYGVNLGIALADTFTSNAFFNDFDIVLAREFSGVRHDSGDAIQFGRNVIDHYKKLGIDPKTKSIVFSDGLDIPTAINIFKEFTGLIGVSFGIGTNLTNDLSVTPLNIVIKLIECNGKPVVKLSDNPSKAMGDLEMIEKVKTAYGVK